MLMPVVWIKNLGKDLQRERKLMGKPKSKYSLFIHHFLSPKIPLQSVIQIQPKNSFGDNLHDGKLIYELM